ncbi:zinc finger and SCAN domain-containing protein 2-like [Brachyistius frenatus]|uniref:zinc finger and SCAN domain-containing protein 2-like n=1 Tax=Brachyistius frenatus TaxID=100188 RepID=UPI0037E90F83
MSKMRAVRVLVAEKLAAAAEEIFAAVERMITERMMDTSEMSPEQQKAAVHQRLSAVADEIFRILEAMMGECEAEVSRSHQEHRRHCKMKTETHSHTTDKAPLFGSDCEKNISSEQQEREQSRRFSPVRKDAGTEIDSGFVNGKKSHLHRTQVEKGTSTVMETETEGEKCGVPPGGQEALLTKSSDAGSEDNSSDKDVNQKLLKSSKRRTTLRENEIADCCKMCAKSLQKGVAVKKRKKRHKSTATTNKSQNMGRSRCRVCGKFFRYKRSFLKHALTHERTADLCGVCGKHLESGERLKTHLKTHNEEKNQTEDKQSDAESKEEGSDSDDGDKDETKEGSCFQKTESKPKLGGCKNRDLSDLKYRCKVCDKSFCYRASFVKHVQEHKSDADVCGLCGKRFEAEESLRLHLSRAAGPSRGRVCGKFSRRCRSFLKHALKHERTADLRGVCGKHLDSDEHLQTHEEENGCRDDERPEAESSDGESKEEGGDEDWEKSEGSDSGEGEEGGKETTEAKNKPKQSKHEDSSHLKHRCRVCGKSFCYRASFLRHVQEDERDADLCGVCGKRFESEESLKLHLQTYVRTNDCEVCGKHFDGLKQLETHARTHTGEKPFVCSVCGKAFAQNGNLMGHMRVHTGEKPYACSVCGQSFSFKEYMRAHMRIHTGEKPFLCSVCGKGFRQRGTLKTHTMIHTGESTHRCLVCDKKFYKSGALKIHMRSHTGEKPYLCNVCGKSFTAGGSLTKHMGVHDGRTAAASSAKTSRGGTT